MDDIDVWGFISPDDLWIYDKLILSRKFNYHCGPAGTLPHTYGEYIIRPCVNFLMMGKGARVDSISPDKKYFDVPAGYFWCERFQGRHFSFDYYKGDQVLSVEGFRDDPDRLDRFSRWDRIDLDFDIPDILLPLTKKYDWLNLECIDDNIIEVHLRFNDDFEGHSAKTIIPVWEEEFKESKYGDRVGFILK